MLRWGATDDEVDRPYPGADLVPGGKRTATMAATIEAPPAQVWPWLVQMGANRAGWYSWDWLDNLGNRSADRIHPEWQEISLRDRVANVLRSLGVDEVRSVIAEQGACTVTCEFCQKPYKFDAIDVEHLFDQVAPKGSDSIN